MTPVSGTAAEPVVFDSIAGQDRAVAQLRAAARSPVHAYLFVGPSGGGKRAAARAFAAAILCSRGGCGSCDVCVRVAAEVHPDVVVVERQGPYISVDQAREIQRLAMRTPNEAAVKVLVLTDFHLVRLAAGTLLKVVEEPPASAVFVILAEHVPAELVTIASRCARIDFGVLSAESLVSVLQAEGIAADVAVEVAEAAGGSIDRARLLASDPGFRARRDAWRSVPTRLDGSGATAAVLAGELAVLLASAAVGPLEERHAAERTALAERIERTGERGAGRKQLDERHRRELRRLRTDELRFGLTVLAAAYRDALVIPGAADGAAVLRGIQVVQAALEALAHNPNELLLLQSVLVQLPPLAPSDAILAPSPG